MITCQITTHNIFCSYLTHKSPPCVTDRMEAVLPQELHNQTVIR